VSWQIVPKELDELLKGENAERVMAKFLQMKIDLEELRAG
jgi:predicted 3-demethylubiquinone-9 3-methyltransferase (glyoxalase superfamily)